MSYLEKVLAIILAIRQEKDIFLENSNISYIDLSFNDKNIISFMGVLQSWGEKTKEQFNSQIKLKKMFYRLKELALLIGSNIPEDRLLDLNKSLTKIENWINMQGDPPSLSSKSSITRFDDELELIVNFFNLLRTKTSDIVFFPDTNTIIEYSEFSKYLKLTDYKKITIIILPTIISELDKLKLIHKNEEFRLKVTSIIRRLKGYRKQGDILEGVIIEKGKICLKMIAYEPIFENMPSWINKDNNDDKIIAGILDYQAKHLNSNCYLLSGDINMLNKAELSSINYFDNDNLL